MPLRPRIPDRRRGFTLTELLVVVAIMALLTTVGLPSIGGIGSAGKMTQAVVELSGLMDQARQYAVAQNTYVWIAFLKDTTAQNQDQVTVAVIASQDGTDPNPAPGGAYDYGAVPNASLVLLGKVRSFSQLQLKAAGTFTASDIASLAGLPAAGTANDLSSQATFHVPLPGAAAAAFTQSIVFLPTGEARNGAGPIDLLEFGLEPEKTQAALLAANAAVVRVSGLTGQTMVYRR